MNKDRRSFSSFGDDQGLNDLFGYASKLKRNRPETTYIVRSSGPFPDQNRENIQKKELFQRLGKIEKRISQIEKSNPIKLSLNNLINKGLKKSIDILVEPDDDGFIARSVDMPLYGFGDDYFEAIENLKCEIESTYDDLMEDDNYSDEWLNIKRFLVDRINPLQ